MPSRPKSFRQSIDKASGAVKGYSFNNATENISATRHLLAKKIGLTDTDVSDQADLPGSGPLLLFCAPLKKHFKLGSEGASR